MSHLHHSQSLGVQDLEDIQCHLEYLSLLPFDMILLNGCPWQCCKFKISALQGNIHSYPAPI